MVGCPVGEFADEVVAGFHLADINIFVWKMGLFDAAGTENDTGYTGSLKMGCFRAIGYASGLIEPGQVTQQSFCG